MTKYALVIFACLLAAPMAAAHTTYTTEDGDRITVGSRNEPIYLFQPTGLDLAIRDAQGNGITGAHNYLDATLVAPDGSEFSQPLSARHGAPGSYNFADGFMYTQPGAYQLRLEGTYKADGPDVTGVEIFVGSAPTTVDPPIFFPDTDFPDQAAMLARIQALEEQMDAMMDEAAGNTSERAPGLGPLALLGTLAVVGSLRRR